MTLRPGNLPRNGAQKFQQVQLVQAPLPVTQPAHRAVSSRHQTAGTALLAVLAMTLPLLQPPADRQTWTWAAVVLSGVCLA